MDLLIVPLALVGIGLLFSMLQDTRQQNLENQRQEQALVIENQRAKAERELAEQRAQDEALQAYLSQMGSLLLEKDLRESEENSEVRTLARARTLTVLGRLGPSRKTAVMEFLIEAELVQKVEGRGPIISLRDADLREANLREVNLRGANLSGAIVYDAYLRFANLREADLREADLREANLSNAFSLAKADLRDANLREADLREADLGGAYLSGAYLSGATGITNEELEQQAETLEGATMPNGQKYEDWLKDREKRQQDE